MIHYEMSKEIKNLIIHFSCKKDLNCITNLKMIKTYYQSPHAWKQIFAFTFISIYNKPLGIEISKSSIVFSQFYFVNFYLNAPECDIVYLCCACTTNPVYNKEKISKKRDIFCYSNQREAYDVIYDAM